MPSFPFETLTELMPHGMCFLWDPTLLGLHVISDSLIALSYFSIPLALVYFTKKGGTFPFKYLFGLFSVFIFACGVTHLLNIWTVWNPDYYVEGMAKFFTAGISLVTAVVLWPVVYQVLSLPNLFVLQDANTQLEQEINRRRAIEEELRTQATDLKETNDELLALNRHLCGRELRMLELKQEINSLSQSLGRPYPYILDQPTT
jgi:two-component system, NtrC family, sensor kinase